MIVLGKIASLPAQVTGFALTSDLGALKHIGCVSAGEKYSRRAIACVGPIKTSFCSGPKLDGFIYQVEDL
jgi:hypothetical protein